MIYETSFADYQTQNAQRFDNPWLLNVNDPCEAPTCFAKDEASCNNGSTRRLSTADEYYYTGSNPSLTFTPSVYLDPVQCLPEITWTCSLV